MVLIQQFKTKGFKMILVNNKVQVEGLILSADWQTIKTQNIVLKKIAFNDDEKAALKACNFDFAAFDDLKAVAGSAESAEEKAKAFEDIKSTAPCFLYLKQRVKESAPVVVAVAFDNKVYLNQNVDDSIGVGAEATRYKYSAFINGFVNHFLESLTDDEKATAVDKYKGADFKVVKSAFDERKSTAPVGEDCIALD